MKAAGIIAEYNPFHRGHRYHLQQTKAAAGGECAVVCVMSGDFVQRGEPALWDKWTRARMAVENGVDLVLELPFLFACNDAELFAYGAFGILDRLGCVTDLCFGSESGDLKELLQVGAFLAEEPEEFKMALSTALEQGISFPAAREKALRICLGEDCGQLLREPNNILAVEYIKQWKQSGSSMRLHTVRRQGQGYHERGLAHPMASASAIREKILKDKSYESIFDFLPEETVQVLKEIGDTYRQINELDKLIFYKIRTTETGELSQVYSVREGLEHRLKKALIHAQTAAELVEAVKSKRYTQTRIKRVLCHIFTGLLRQDVLMAKERGLLYGRVLGFSERGAVLLRSLKKKEGGLPIITNLKKRDLEEREEGAVLKYDVLAADLYNLICRSELYSCSDFVKSPFVIKREKND